jgi:hypothetical protein
MKLIFLDIDGVLNTEASAKAEWERRGQKAGVSQDLDPECCKQLTRICQETGATIILSSVWRYSWPLPLLTEHLRKFGADVYLADKTPRVRAPEGKTTCPRGLEIAAYLTLCNNKGGVDSFVIIDDDSDMEFLSPFLVQTTAATGLTQKLADQIIEKLGETQPKEVLKCT